MRSSSTLLCVALLLVLQWDPIQAQQDNAPTVPDVVGQTLPEAIATLNEAGLLVGSIEQELYSSEDDALVNEAVVLQAPGTDARLEETSAVDLVVARAPNITFFYNTEQFTWRSDDVVPFLHFANLRFQVQGDATVRFSEADEVWDFNGLREVAPNFCIQVWAKAFEGFVKIDPCEQMRTAISVPDGAHHFWIGEGRFEIYQDDLLLGSCAQTMADADELEDCRFAIASSETAVATHTTPYAYFRYDREQLYIENRSADRLMPFMRFDLQTEVALDAIVYDFNSLPELQPYLAPGQCLWLYRAGAAPFADMTCTVVASAEVPERQVFWREGFTLRPQQDRQQSQACPAPVDNRPMLCVVPR